MKRIITKMQVSIYRKFFFSFTMVLILPIIVYSFLYMNYYQKIMEENVLAQTKLSLEMVGMELNRYEEEFQAIAGQNSNLSFTTLAYLKTDFNAQQIISLLSSETATHAYIDEIFFYNSGMQDRIYTQEGTYLSQFFRQYKGTGQKGFSFSDYLEKLENYGWILYDEDSLTGKKGIIYVYCTRSLKSTMPAKNVNYWVFHIDTEHLEALLETEGAVTVLYDSYGNQLYPYEPVDDSMQSNNKNPFVEVTNGNIRLVRYIDQVSFFAQVEQMRNLFLISSMILMIAGGSLVAYLSSYNKKPIEELKLYCESKCQEIPETQGELDVFRFTIDQMEERMKFLNKRQKEERLLFKLIYEKDNSAENLQEELVSTGMYQQADRYCALIITLAGELGTTVSSSSFLYVLFDERYEVHLTENAGQNIFIGVLGMKETDWEGMSSYLKEIARKISDNFCFAVHFFVGGKCEKREEIHWSYMQALQLMQGAQKDNGWGVVCEERSARREVQFIYPELELGSLANALSEADHHAVSLVTDVLLDIVMDNKENLNVYIPLCYDIIQIFTEANEKLELDEPELKKLLDKKKLRNLMQAQEFTQLIDCVRTHFKAAMQKERREEQTENLAARVIAFIDQNSKNPEICVSLVADKFNMSISNLSHKFKAMTNRNISDYIMERKLGYVKELILETDYSIQKIAEMAGYTQSASLSQTFKKYYRMTPMEYRELYKRDKNDEEGEQALG